MGLFATNRVQTVCCVFVPTFCGFVYYLWLHLKDSSFEKLVTISLFGWEVYAVQQDSFYPNQYHEQNNFYKNPSLFINGRSLQDEKPTTYLQLAQKGNLSNRVWQNLLFYHHSQSLCDLMQKEIRNLEFVKGVKFEFIDSLKNNGTKYLLIFDDSRGETCNSKAFVDIAAAGRHRGLSTIYIKHNLFPQSKLGRDVELQTTHIVLLKSPRDVMQVSTLSGQLELWSALVDCYRDAKSVPYGHLLIDLSPRTDDLSRYCTNTGSIPSNFYIPDRLKQSKTLAMNTQNLSILQVFQWISHKCKRLFLQCCSKEFIRFFCECVMNLFEGNLQTTKNYHVATFQSEFWLLPLKRTNWKQRSYILASERGLQLNKVFIPPVINDFSWHGAICPRSCFRVQQKFDYPVSSKAGTSKVSTFTKSHVPNWFS